MYVKYNFLKVFSIYTDKKNRMWNIAYCGL